MILSDRDILWAMDGGRVSIYPFNKNDVQPCSIDLHLGNSFAKNDKRFFSQEYEIQPGEFILATTDESVVIGDDLLGRLEGKSSIARLGLIIHTTAGFIDPGFRGQITLEIANLSNKPITLKAKQPIAQICFEELSSSCVRPYGSQGLGSHYQNQRGATPSRFSPSRV